jgi:hypothetical protein
MEISVLISVLHEATCLDLEKRTAAMNLLAQYELMEMFHANLQQIYFNKENEIKVRSLAAIYLKNGINKYWRKTAKGSIKPQEREIIRQNQLNLFNEPSKKVNFY